MKRIIPYFLLQMALSSLFGCAAMQPLVTAPQPAYQVTLTTPADYADQLHNVLAGVPVVIITDSQHGILPSTHPFEIVELKLQGPGAVEQFKRSLQSSGIPVTTLEIKEAGL